MLRIPKSVNYSPLERILWPGWLFHPAESKKTWWSINCIQLSISLCWNELQSCSTIFQEFTMHQYSCPLLFVSLCYIWRSTNHMEVYHLISEHSNPHPTISRWLGRSLDKKLLCRATNYLVCRFISRIIHCGSACSESRSANKTTPPVSLLPEFTDKKQPRQ